MYKCIVVVGLPFLYFWIKHKKYCINVNMFDFSWAEIVVVAFVGLLLIGPNELPSVIKNCRKAIKKIKEMGREFTSAVMDSDDVNDLKKEVDKVNKDMRTIIDLDGNEQETYDMSDIMTEIKKPAKKNKP